MVLYFRGDTSGGGESMKKFIEDLNFDRVTNCDWCNKKTKISICHYGTTDFNRLICKECAKKINDYEKKLNFTIWFNPEKLKD